MKNKLEDFVKKRKKSLIWLAGFLVVFLYFFTAWGITITVLDAETKKPIEGASCIAWWDVTAIDGHTFTAKIIEAKTDENGKFRVPMVFGFKAFSTPDIQIYKQGYVGWSRKYIYQGPWEKYSRIPMEKDRNFKMKSQNVYLEKFKDGFTHYSHEQFLSHYLPVGVNPSKLGIANLKFEESLAQERLLSRKDHLAFEKQRQLEKESQ